MCQRERDDDGEMREGVGNMLLIVTGIKNLHDILHCTTPLHSRYNTCLEGMYGVAEYCFHCIGSNGSIWLRDLFCHGNS